MDGDVSRRLDNDWSAASVVEVVADNRSAAASPSAAVVVAVVGCRSCCLPLPRSLPSAASESTTAFRPVFILPSTSPPPPPLPPPPSSSSSSLNSRPAERDGRACCVLCRLRFGRRVAFGAPHNDDDDDDGSYDCGVAVSSSAAVCGRRPSQSSAVFRAVAAVAIAVAGLRASVLCTARKQKKNKINKPSAVFFYRARRPRVSVRRGGAFRNFSRFAWGWAGEVKKRYFRRMVIKPNGFHPLCRGYLPDIYTTSSICTSVPTIENDIIKK